MHDSGYRRNTWFVDLSLICRSREVNSHFTRFHESCSVFGMATSDLPKQREKGNNESGAGCSKLRSPRYNWSYIRLNQLFYRSEHAYEGVAELNFEQTVRKSYLRLRKEKLSVKLSRSGGSTTNHQRSSSPWIGKFPRSNCWFDSTATRLVG